MKVIMKTGFFALIAAIIMIGGCSNNSDSSHTHTFGKITVKNGVGTKACSVCGYVAMKGPVLKGNSDPIAANDYTVAILKTGAKLAYSSNVEKIVFGLLSDSKVKAAISRANVSATKQEIGVVDGVCYAYFDEASETVYIVPSDEEYTGFIFNENCYKMFNSFFVLKEIKGLELADTSNVTNMSAMFADCNELTTLDLSNFDTSNVTDMSDMFYMCLELTSLDVSKFNTLKVTDMSMMFADCTALTTLDVSNFDTSNVSDMGMMFYACEALKTIYVKDSSKFVPSGCVATDMFKDCGASTLTTKK